MKLTPIPSPSRRMMRMFLFHRFGHCFAGKRAWHRLSLPPARSCWTCVNVQKLLLARNAPPCVTIGTSSSNMIPGAFGSSSSQMQKTCFEGSSSCSMHAETCKTHTSSAHPGRTCQPAQHSFHLHSGATALFTDGQLHEEEEDE